MSFKDWDPTARCRELSLLMTSWKSETGTDGERSFGPKLAELIGALPYFRDHPGHLRLVPSHDGTLNVVAMVRGRSSKALLFAGHYDTVPVANYRDLAPLATEPGALREALLDDLRSRPLSPNEEKALHDLESGAFMPGRGLLDMKAGLAAGLAVLERAADQGCEGSLIFCATPDEERNSRGMRSLRDTLPALMREWDLEIIGGINLDATSDQEDGAGGRAIYRGTIGKLLPFAYVLGQPSHASYPFEGVSAHLIGAEILRRIEANPALCDLGDGEVSPPPICLEAKDFREGYDVTTPGAAWFAFNWLFHSLDPATVYHRFNDIVREAMEWATAYQSGHAQTYAELTGEIRADVSDGMLLSFTALKDRAFAIGGESARDRYEEKAVALAGENNPLVASRLLTELLIAEARLAGPAVITGFASLHYPPTRLSTTEDTALELSAAIEAARLRMEREDGVAITYRNIFTGISDMSFLGHQPDETSVETVAANTAHPAMIDRPPPDALGFPVVNIGPWGREYHQRLERVHSAYAWRDLPRFLQAITEELFH